MSSKVVVSHSECSADSATATALRLRPFKPPPFYLLTGALNAVLWRLPLPRRLVVRLDFVLYRNPPMPARLVVAVVDRLRAAGVRCWISGGWGVDALVGRHTRTHRDLDLVVAERDMPLACAAMAQLGFAEWYREHSQVPLESRLVFHDHPLAGRTVDLHPLEAAGAGDVEFATGTVAGRAVPCLAPATQLAAHEGYTLRGHDRSDIASLRALAERSTRVVAPERRANAPRRPAASRA
jgi:lincosamide nucleotidyltransferase A/C/D/E